MKDEKLIQHEDLSCISIPDPASGTVQQDWVNNVWEFLSVRSFVLKGISVVLPQVLWEVTLALAGSDSQVEDSKWWVDCYRLYFKL